MDFLREEVQKLCDGEESSAQAVVTEKSEDYDPVAEVEQVDQDGTSTSPSKTRGRGQKRTRYYQNHACKKVVTLKSGTKKDALTKKIPSKMNSAKATSGQKKETKKKSVSEPPPPPGLGLYWGGTQPSTGTHGTSRT